MHLLGLILQPSAWYAQTITLLCSGEELENELDVHFDRIEMQWTIAFDPASDHIF